MVERSAYVLFLLIDLGERAVDRKNFKFVVQSCNILKVFFRQGGLPLTEIKVSHLVISNYVFQGWAFSALSHLKVILEVEVAILV